MAFGPGRVSVVAPCLAVVVKGASSFLVSGPSWVFGRWFEVGCRAGKIHLRSIRWSRYHLRTLHLRSGRGWKTSAPFADV